MQTIQAFLKVVLWVFFSLKIILSLALPEDVTIFEKTWGQKNKSGMG
jgi:hypothetical protein